MSTPRTIATLALTASLFALASCSDSDDESSDSSAQDPEAECTVDDITVDGGFGEKPSVTIPDDCAPPTTVLTEDLVEGSGPEAAEGDSVLTDYLLVTWSNKEVLDNSFDRGEKFPVEPLGQAPVIDGWNEGLVGIQKGDRRLIIIPPDKAYGEGGQGIEPDETLVFVVDAAKIS